MKDNYHNDNDVKSFQEKRKNKINNFKLDLDDDFFSDIPNAELNDDSVKEYRKEKKQDNYDLSDYDLTTYEEKKEEKPQDTPLYEDDEKSTDLNSFSADQTKQRYYRDSAKANRLEKKMAKKRDRQKSKKNRRLFFIMWILMVCVAGGVLASYIVTGLYDMLAVERSKEPTTVTIAIPDNSTVDSVATLFTKQGIINEPAFFKMYATLTKSADSFTQGTYEMDTDMDYEAIINYIQSMSNRIDTVSVQITEGMSVQEIATKLNEEGVLDNKDEFINMCNSSDFDEDYSFIGSQKNANKKYYKLEGYLFPDTYEFYMNEDPNITITRFLDNYENKVVNTTAKAKGYKKPVSIEKRAKDSGYTLDQIMTIASIIQAEAANKEDMYYISSILHNRIEAGTASDVAYLGLDSTLFYPYRNKKSVPKDMAKTFTSNYDTYKLKGLPPGPICNPGLDAINAAIDPYNTSYYYFCHDDNGTAYYARTYGDHQYYLSLIS